jgi:uncharacterized membrane protein YcaP (DUF421 family)
MDPQDLLLTAVRATIIYFFLLIVIRVLGKRSVGAIGAFDLLVALMLGEVVDEAIFGDVSMVKGMLAITVIAVWHFVDEWATYRSKRISRLTEGEPTLLIKDGQTQTLEVPLQKEDGLWRISSLVDRTHRPMTKSDGR